MSGAPHFLSTARLARIKYLLMSDLPFSRVLVASLLMAFRVLALALGGYFLVKRKV